MVSGSAAPLAGVPFAHPVTGHPHLDVPVALVASSTAVVALSATLLARTAPTAESGAVADTSSWAGSLPGRQVATRTLAVLLLLLAIVAGRVGSADELENLAPALVVGAGWPLLVAGSLVLGPVWRWVDPWDGMARALARQDTSEPPGHVWPAVLLALPWLWVLGVHPRPLDPRTVGAALAVYTTVTLAGALAVGRRRWLSSAEPVGILLSWFALARQGRLGGWVAPAGAEALLGVAAGGLLFSGFRRTEVWVRLSEGYDPTAAATAGLALSCALGAALVMLAAYAGGLLGGGATVARGVVPAVAGIALAVALARNRFFTSVQLLPSLLGDPLGRGWDLLGAAGQGLDPAPLGAVGLLVVQLAVLLGCHAWGGFVAGRGAGRGARAAAAVLLAYLTAVSVTVVALH